MDAMKTEVINQIRELNALLIQAKLHVGRTKLAQHLHGGGEDFTSELPSFHGQGRLLSILGLHPDRSETSPRDLSFMLGMSKQVVIDLLAKLEQKGLIVRKQADEQTGTQVIALTEKGREAADHVRNPEVGGTELLDCLSPEELEQFNSYLNRIIENAESKCANDEFAERRKAMQEFFSLVHHSVPDEEGVVENNSTSVRRVGSEGGNR